jgi:hypothetical protein
LGSREAGGAAPALTLPPVRARLWTSLNIRFWSSVLNVEVISKSNIKCFKGLWVWKELWSHKKKNCLKKGLEMRKMIILGKKLKEMKLIKENVSLFKWKWNHKEWLKTNRNKTIIQW